MFQVLCLALLAAIETTGERVSIQYASAKARRTDHQNCFIVRMRKSVGASALAPSAHTMFAKVPGTAGAVFQDALNGFWRCGMNKTHLDMMANDPDILSIHEDQVIKPTVTQYPLAWGLDRVDQRNLPLSGSYTYDTNAQGAGVFLFIVDTGLRTTHNEFTGRVKPGKDFTDSGSVDDCIGHGTHVAGTAAGTTYGIAKQAWVVPLRVFDCSGEGTFSAVISAIDYVMQQASMRPAVISMSLGPKDPARMDDVDQAVTNAINRGVTVVVSAGNDNIDACRSSPGAVPAVITVGSSTNNDARSDFSNWGTCVDIFAPGSSIVSSYIGTNTARTYMSGTSMAAPHVSGAAAVLLGQNPSYTPAQVSAILVGESTLGKVTGAGTGSPNRLLFLRSMGSSTATVAITVGPSTSGTKTVTVPAGLVCRSPCGPGCHLNTDWAGAPDNFQVTISGTQMTVTRLDNTYPWAMNLILPCSMPVTVVQVPVGPSIPNTRTVTVPAGLICPSTCDSGCRLNTDYASAPDNFQITVSGTQLTAKRLDSTNPWAMNLIVPCKLPLVPITVGASTGTTKTVTVPAGLTCRSPCGPGCRLNLDYATTPDNFRVTVSGTQMTVTRLDSTYPWAMNLILPCTVPAVVYSSRRSLEVDVEAPATSKMMPIPLILCGSALIAVGFLLVVAYMLRRPEETPMPLVEEVALEAITASEETPVVEEVALELISA